MSDFFKINEITGLISVANNVDFEKDKKIEFRVEAKDQGGLTDTSKVEIEITDINDNEPVINVMSFTSPVSEDSPVGTTIGIINVKDLDSGENGQVRCSVEGNAPVEIKSNVRNYYALVTNAPLDRETLSEFNITVIASDLGKPPLSVNKIFNLKISDVNDNAPVFTRALYTATLSENNSPGFSVLNVVGKDPDDNQNAHVSYILEECDIGGSPVSGYISVNSETGVISAARSFDYEQTKEFVCVIKAQDGGSPPLSSNVTVKILIQDQNDNAPQVLYPVQTGGSLVAEMVPRSADVGYLVTKVVAVDVDSGQNAWLSYKLQKAADRALFEVGSQNGEIRTIRQVTDKDAVKQRLAVIVEDNGQPSRSATVIVNVAVADSFPEVLSEFTDFTHDKEYNDNLTFYLVLALAVVSFLFITCVVVIISVKIYRWRQSRILYHSNLPVIPYYPPRYSDTLGTGTLSHVYNYDTCRTTDSRKSDIKYMQPMSQSLVSVDDVGNESAQNGHQISTTSTLSVSGQARYSVPEEQAEGSFVGNIAADLGIDVRRLVLGNARIVTKKSRQYVDLNRDKDILVVKERIDREELCKKTTPCSFSFEIILENPIQLYRVTVEVTDVNDNTPAFSKDNGGAPQRSGTARIHITVLDANDNAPVCSKQVYKAEVQENSAIGTVVTTVSANDADKGVNARDAGSPPLSSVVSVKILIQDQNDNAPQVLYPVQTGGSLVAEMVPRSADVGYLVTKVVAVDVDSGQNAWLSYKLQKAADRALFEWRTTGSLSFSYSHFNVAVADSFPEVLSEFTDFTHDKEYNDNLTFYLVLALAVVSFLFITCVVVIISVKIYRWRQSRILYHSNLPVIPYYPPRYSDTLAQGLSHTCTITTRAGPQTPEKNKSKGLRKQLLDLFHPSTPTTHRSLSRDYAPFEEARDEPGAETKSKLAS
ncbi:hypothetical protein WMY93_009627 [Mugilogobius chulae]|uniref:Cadherin domain-containing protein n=1 Tax=Mugilogobius chulae TaxID=88201 RepID=A0AAW0PL27_9GOBI